MKYLKFSVIFLLIILFPSTTAFSKSIDDYAREISELESKINLLKNESKTLSGQIAYYDSQISLNELKISQTEELINSLIVKINNLESNLNQRSKSLAEQISYSYKLSRSTGNLDLLLSSRNFSDFLHKTTHYQTVQKHTRDYLKNTQTEQLNFIDQKSQLEISEKKLVAQKESLSAVRLERDNLLKQTKNNESIYQKQLQQAKLELETIQKALAAAKRVGPVKAGDPIALTGNTGYPSCSTGKHLHFEVRKNNEWQNAENYLKPLTDKWGIGLGTGSWDWPLKGEIQITQRYGKTPYSYRYVYSGGIHTGIDMVSSSDIIYAPADGTLFSATEKCGSSELKLKYIDHGDGLTTLYLHVQ